MSDIVHVVLFKFKSDARPRDVQEASANFLGLLERCLHPTTKTPYITSLKAGKDHSPGGMQDGLTHGFVVGFSSTEDRDYYVKSDTAHLAFAGSIKGMVEKATVLEFTDGLF